MDWYCWFPADYKADTMHLTAEQDGIYRRLIDFYMETKQPLPDNDNALARAAGIDLEQWVKSAAIIRPFFTPKSDGKLHLKKCDLQIARQMAKSVSHAERGKKGAKLRWENKLNNQYADSISYSLAIAEPMANDSRGDKSREVSNKKTGTKKGERFSLEIMPDSWRDFCLAENAALNPQSVFDRFRDYWIAQPGQQGVKLNWDATWRNWVRNEKRSPNANIQTKITRPTQRDVSE